MKKIILILLFVLIAGLCSVSNGMAEIDYSDYGALDVNSAASLKRSKAVSMWEYEMRYNNLSPEKKAGPIGQSILDQWAEIEQRYDKKIKAAEEAEAYYENLKKQK